MTASRSKDGLHPFPVRFEQIVRYKALYGAGKASAVHAPRTASRKQMFAHGQRERKPLLVRIFAGINVLQIHKR